MPNSQLGTRREYLVIDTFVARGFWWIKAHRSGQSINESRAAARIPGDLFVWSATAAFQCEVGGSGKRLGHEFAELRARALPGFRPLVVMFRGGRRWYYTSPSDRHGTLDAVLESEAV